MVAMVRGSRIRQAVIVILLVGLASCDRTYPPVLCNGFSQPVVVAFVRDEGETQEVKLQPGGEAALNVGGAYRSFSVKTLQGQELLAYSAEKLGNVPIGNFGESPYWVITGRGIFEVPHELNKKWRYHLSEIEQAGYRVIE